MAAVLLALSLLALSAGLSTGLPAGLSKGLPAGLSKGLSAGLPSAFLSPQPAFAAHAYDYTVTNYALFMVVGEDNTLAITENISVYFHAPRHGIFRALPLVNHVTRQDGTEARNRARIRDVRADEPFTAYNESGERVIKLGNPDVTLTGEKRYTLHYLYDLGRDTGKGYDELYYNLVGEWDTTVSGVSFAIVMPKGFDPSKLGFSAGARGSGGSQNVSYRVDGDTIVGSYNGTLMPGEYLTVRLELPEGYFIGAGSHTDALMWAALFAPALFLLLYYRIWTKYGKDDPVVEPLEFYPPQGHNSADIAYLYRGYAEDKDVVSLLIYLANEGYLAIEETEKKALFIKKPGFKITKVKDYAGGNKHEEIFMQGLFTNATGANEVTDSDLAEKFYRTIEKIKIGMNAKENRWEVYRRDSLNKRKWGVLLALLAFLLITVRPVLDMHPPVFLLFALLYPGIGLIFVFAAATGALRSRRAAIFGLVIGLLFGGLPWSFIVLPTLLWEPMYLAAGASGLVCIAGICVLLRRMPKRTPYGNEMLGRIRGFKRFLETAEKRRLEELVAEAPEYFYDILPYTYVLGISDKWIKKFEAISLQPPDWYSGARGFSHASFSSFMRTTMTTASSAMTSRPSSSSGSGSSGGFSGGGSSGGGSGGGRGGSW